MMMYPERRKRNIQLISDEERIGVERKIDEDTWGKIEVEHEDDFADLEEGEEILLESDEEEIEVDVRNNYWVEDIENDNSIIRDAKSDRSLPDESLVAFNDYSQNIFQIDGKPFKIKLQNTRPTFQESNTRITTYLENNLYAIVRILQQKKEIESIKAFLNDSVKYYLQEKYKG